MKNRKKIAIIGANAPLIPFYTQAKRLGYEIYSFAWEEGAVCKEYADHFYPISFVEKEKILEICKENNVQGVTSFSLESALPTVNFVARGLNAPCNSIESEQLVENKYTMRNALYQDNVSVPLYIEVQSSEEVVNIPYPVVVKPIDSGGSRGVTKVESVNDIKCAIDRALSYSKSKKVLVEQFIDGREFSVEYISYKGVHKFITITEKITTGSPYFVELEHHQPANLTLIEVEKIKKITEDTLNSLKIYSTPTHTELKINAEGELYIIEVGPRMGGDFITSDLVRLSTGYDFVKATIELSTNNFIEPFNYNKHCSGVYFLSSETLRLLPYFNKIRDISEIYSAKIYNQEIKSVKESSDRSGHIIYQSINKFII